jgi:hypothetical protein
MNHVYAILTPDGKIAELYNNVEASEAHAKAEPGMVMTGFLVHSHYTPKKDTFMSRIRRKARHLARLAGMRLDS